MSCHAWGGLWHCSPSLSGMRRARSVGLPRFAGAKASGDMVILNKIDLADTERLDELRQFIYSRMPQHSPTGNLLCRRPVRRSRRFRTAARIGPTDGSTPQRHQHHAHAGHQFESWVHRRDKPFDIDRLEAAIKQLPRTVCRVKSFVFAGQDPQHRHLLRAVGMRGDIAPFDPWGDRRPSTELVVIATSGQQSRPHVGALLDAGLSAL